MVRGKRSTRPVDPDNLAASGPGQAIAAFQEKRACTEEDTGDCRGDGANRADRHRWQTELENAARGKVAVCVEHGDAVAARAERQRHVRAALGPLVSRYVAKRPMDVRKGGQGARRLQGYPARIGYRRR